MTRPRTVEERVTDVEAEVATAYASAEEAKTRAQTVSAELAELRTLVEQAHEVLKRLEGYERDLKWLRGEREKAR